MARFDFFLLESRQLVVDLQTDLIGINATRIVPLLRDVERYVSFPGLTPSVDLDGATRIVRFHEMAAVRWV